jgi:hypothetical protein
VTGYMNGNVVCFTGSGSGGPAINLNFLGLGSCPGPAMPPLRVGLQSC